MPSDTQSPEAARPSLVCATCRPRPASPGLPVPASADVFMASMATSFCACGRRLSARGEVPSPLQLVLASGAPS